MLHSPVVILTTHMDSVFCLGQQSFTSTAMFKLRRYKGIKDMEVQYIRDKALNESALRIVVCLHNCAVLRQYCIIAVFPPCN